MLILTTQQEHIANNYLTEWRHTTNERMDTQKQHKNRPIAHNHHIKTDVYTVFDLHQFNTQITPRSEKHACSCSGLKTKWAMFQMPRVKQSCAAPLVGSLVNKAKGCDKRFDQYLLDLQKDLNDQHNLEYRARALVEKMALSLQGSLLLRHDFTASAEAFCAGRLQGHSGNTYGMLPLGIDCDALIDNARLK